MLEVCEVGVSQGIDFSTFQRTVLNHLQHELGVTLTKFNPEKDPLDHPTLSLADQIEQRLDASLKRKEPACPGHD